MSKRILDEIKSLLDDRLGSLNNKVDELKNEVERLKANEANPSVDEGETFFPASSRQGQISQLP